MTNSTSAGARGHITAQYLSENEPIKLRRFHYVKISRYRINAPGEGRHMRMPILNQIESQTDQADGSRLEKPCKKIGQKSDKAKSKLLKQELFSREGKVLQNLYSAVRSRPAPPSALRSGTFPSKAHYPFALIEPLPYRKHRAAYPTFTSKWSL